ncbi:MAG: rpoC, partial [Myxococcaceae bacterium]|nr:rpoC [Myxococcaceae bacterium]
ADLEARLTSARSASGSSVPGASAPSTDLTSSDLYNLRTGKPERGGLACSRIFGPVDDDACLCGKYEGTSHRGVVCEKCGVLVGSSELRQLWPGRIVLPVPIVHPWFVDTVASALEVPPDDLATVVPLGDRIEARVMGVAIRERLGDAGHLIDALAVVPAGWREPTWREIDPAETAKQRQIFEEDRDRRWMEKRVYSESHLRALTHEPIAGGLNRRYAAVVEGCARLRGFLDRAAPWPVIHAEEGELFAAIASLIGGSRYPRAARRTATPSSIAARIDAAFEEGKDKAAVADELLFAGVVATT